MLKTIPQYLSAISDTYGLTKTLGVIGICRTESGELDYKVGNNSIIFRIRIDDRTKMLKCYTRSKQNTRRIYGEKCLHEELYIHSDSTHGEWVDVVLDDWVEGQTLQNAIIVNRNNAAELHKLAEAFDRMALELLRQDWAHGDIKPENIIVTPGGEMQLIDFDAVYLPSFAGEQSEECGTAAFQHPARSIDYFNKSIDDYPIALISTALHALSVDPTLSERYDIEDILLFNPKELVNGRSSAHKEVLSLFAYKCKAVQYRIAKLLDYPTPQLRSLRRLLEYAVNDTSHNINQGQKAQLSLENIDGYWGYCIGDQAIISPVYDSGFEFHEGLAAVGVGDCWHYINTEGVSVLSCPQCEEIQSFRNGSAVVIINGVRKRINRNGEII